MIELREILEKYQAEIDEAAEQIKLIERGTITPTVNGKASNETTALTIEILLSKIGDLESVVERGREHLFAHGQE